MYLESLREAPLGLGERWKNSIQNIGLFHVCLMKNKYFISRNNKAHAFLEITPVLFCPHFRFLVL